MRAVIARLMAVFGLVMLLGTGAAAQAQGDAAAGEGKIATCVACHGNSGNDAILPDVPYIGGQNEKYLLKQMVEIKSGVRQVPLMTGMLNNLDEQDMADVAAWYASQPLPQGAADPEMLALGESMYRAGNMSLGIAACTACHSPTAFGNKGAGYPALSGQDPAYTAAQLRAFRDGSRSNDEAAVMRTLSERLTDREIDALASYVAGLRQAL